MRFAYADPPYSGQAKRHYDAEAKRAGREAKEVNHECLIGYLCEEFPDGWALSTSTNALRDLLPTCPRDVRVMAWVKRFTTGLTAVRPPYAWEPVIVRGGRKTAAQRKGMGHPLVFDWVQADPVVGRVGLRKSDADFFAGAKPNKFCVWLFNVLGAVSGDELVDVFPGSGAVGRAWESFMGGPMFNVGA